LRWVDRALLIWLYRRCPRILDAVTIVRPETVVRQDDGIEIRLSLPKARFGRTDDVARGPFLSTRPVHSYAAIRHILSPPLTIGELDQGAAEISSLKGSRSDHRRQKSESDCASVHELAHAGEKHHCR